jgi:trigger factor
MSTELIEISPTRREIKIEIEPAAVREVYDKVSKKYAQKASVPGFRKGFAPLDVVRLRFRDEINSDVLQQLLPQKITEAIQEHNQTPITEPHVHLANQDNLKLNGSESISVNIHFDVMPEIPAPEYKNMELTRRVRPVTDAEVEDVIEEQRQEQAALIPIENRKSQEGDTVIVDLTGTFEGEPDAAPIVANDLEIPLGDEVIEKAFTENLIGVEEDEEKEFTVSYPEDFSSPGLAGKTVTYKAKIKSLGKVEVPELNDEWVQTLDEGYESLDDFRGKLRENMQQFAEADANARLRVDAVAKLIEKHEFEIPSALIDMQARNLLNNFAQDLAQRGVDLSKVEKDFVEMAYSQMRTQAERDVRGAMLLEKVAELEEVEVSDEEIAEEIRKMADYYRVGVEEVQSSLKQQNGEANIANNLRTRKAIEAIVKNAKIEEGEWVEPNQVVSEAENKPEETGLAAESAEETAKEKPKAKKKSKGESKSKSAE